MSGVRVTRGRGPHVAHPGIATLCTPRFCTRRTREGLAVEHDLTPDEISDELAVLLAAELDDVGVLRGQPEFESVFTGIVQSVATDGDPDGAWRVFYRNSLHRLESGCASFAPVHRRAAALVVGRRVVDLGSCFGFFPLRLAGDGLDVTATDLSAPTMDLLDRTSTRLGRPIRTVVCDAARVPLPAGVADTVTVLHLLEHLDPTASAAVLDEAVRLTRRRVVVAVPFEDVPRACYGHVQRFDLDALQEIAAAWRAAGIRATVHEYHGGWLVLDR
ncbi:mycofactocin oligosaccharide methyltransferase MftM [Mycobacterium yunnanensis]|nr:mycofactocin oligosaccharide methyltransferase MftM [Mycobacterium yunnanensis]